MFQLVESFQTWVDDVNGHAEGLGDGLNDFEGDGIASGFDASDVGALQSCAVGQLLLSESGLLAERSDAVADALPDLLFHFFIHSSFDLNYAYFSNIVVLIVSSLVFHIEPNRLSIATLSSFYCPSSCIFQRDVLLKIRTHSIDHSIVLMEKLYSV